MGYNGLRKISFRRIKSLKSNSKCNSCFRCHQKVFLQESKKFSDSKKLAYIL